MNGKQYAFSSWSDGGKRTHDVTNTGNKTFTAMFVDVTNTSKAGIALAPTADAYVADGPDAGANFGKAKNLEIKANASVGKNRVAFLTFDISSLGKTFGSALLRVFGSNAGSDVVDTAVYGVSNTSWSEMGINFNNQPALDSTPQSSVEVTDSIGRWYEFELTKYVLAAMSKGKTKVSLALMLPIGGSVDQFNSREASGNKPQLFVS